MRRQAWPDGYMRLDPHRFFGFSFFILILRKTCKTVELEENHEKARAGRGQETK
jgi:hypothetical protein